MSTKTPSIYIECGKCGYQREVTRAEIASGSWRGRCPVCFPEGPKPPTPAGDVGKDDDAGDVTHAQKGPAS